MSNVFDREEENKLEYIRLHHSFKEKIDALLGNLCAELNITEELFAKACIKGLSTPSHKRIFEQNDNRLIKAHNRPKKT
jgi:hypothetical protein